MTRLARLILVGLALLAVEFVSPRISSAMPIGLFNLADTGESAGVYVDGEAVYLSTMTGVWTVTETSQTFTEITHPTLGAPTRLTAPMRGPDGGIYVGGFFLNDDFVRNTSATFNIESPNTVVQEWANTTIGSLDGQLNGYGLLGSFTPGRLGIDGSRTPYVSPPGTASSGAIVDVSVSGIAGGTDLQVNGIGSAFYWPNPTTIESFDINPSVFAVVHSVRDNIDGGQNYGLIVDDQAYVQFGDDPILPLVDNTGLTLLADEIYVTESGFAVINTDSGIFGYHDGLTDTLGVALELAEIFPELTGSYSRAGKPMSIGGEVFIPLDASINLFGALDPTIVPEPSTLGMLLVTLLVFPCSRRVRKCCV